MFMRTLRHGLAALVVAVATSGVLVGQTSPAAADVVPQCQLTAQVQFSLSDPVGRTFGSGTVTCSGVVYRITVKVDLYQDSKVVASASNACQGQSACTAAVAVPNPNGVQTWCALASGTYQLSPEGPVFDLGTKRDCKQG